MPTTVEFHHLGDRQPLLDLLGNLGVLDIDLSLAGWPSWTSDHKAAFPSMGALSYAVVQNFFGAGGVFFVNIF